MLNAFTIHNTVSLQLIDAALGVRPRVSSYCISKYQISNIKSFQIFQFCIIALTAVLTNLVSAKSQLKCRRVTV